MPPNPSKLRLSCGADGCCVIRIEGRGTMNESRSAEAVALRTLEHDASARVVFDLSGCDYLDSTFLGCIVHLYREHGRDADPRFRVAAAPDRRKKLLGPCRLDTLIPATEDIPQPDRPWVDVPPVASDARDLTRHVYECHKLLAEVDSPMRAAFAKIAEQLERELNETVAAR
jgi:anti-anti-sigma regulatory factor